MLRSIYARITLVNFIITILVLTISSTLLLGILDNYLINDRSKMLQSEAERVNETTIYYINNRQYTDADDLSDFYYITINHASERINGVIFVIDQYGNVMTSKNANQFMDVSKITTDFAKKELAGGESIELGDFDGVYNNTYLTVGKPMEYNGSVVGATFVAMPVPEINRYKYHVFKIMLLTLLAAVILALFISLFYLKKVSKPLANISRAAKQIADGNFDVEVPEVHGKTEISELTKNFNMMTKSLKDLENMRSSFIANVSHELRTPMTTISGFVEGILDNTIPDDSKEKYLRIVLDETKRLARLVSELLELARIDAGTLELHIKEFDINELIRVTILRFEKQINDKQLNIELNLYDDNELVLADKDAISRVLTNLFDNAIKFNVKNGYIKVNVNETGNKTTVSVENSGIGFSEEELPHIWERFYKTDKSRSYDKKGMGLGLYMVHGIITAHDEKIWAESEINRWARFTFTLKKSH
ncbi:MAG: HAMP domain-containing histidine kinase [Clostridia bacterium]|nr:HAMP domain-containing histidine kinase [Clostridia bacterium]